MALFKLKNLIIFCFSALPFIFIACSKANSEDDIDTVNSIEEIINDMKLPHEEIAHGTQQYDWGKAPRMGMGNDPKDWTAMITWGQVYESVKLNKAENTRVELRNIKAYYLSKKDNKWHLWQSAKLVEGAAYREDFADDLSKPAVTREEPGGTLSVQCGDGYNFHFWPASGRVAIDPDDITGVFTTCQARLILDDPEEADDRDQSEYLLSIGGDYWETLTAEWDYWKTNGDIAIGRFKYVTKEWKAFNMHTLTETQIQNNPPPLE